jgi:branched-chain amino acid transport system permease protein
MEILLQLVFSGIALGMIYAVIAFGYQLTFATSGTLNFGQGEALMLGALVGLSLVGNVHGGPYMGYLLMIPLVIVFGALQGMFVEWIGVRPAIKIKSEFGWIMSTIALAIIFKNVAENIWGKDDLTFPSPLSPAPFKVLGANVQPMQVAVVVGALAMMLAVELFNRKSIYGKAVVATANDRDAAGLMGINTGMVITFSYALSSATAAYADRCHHGRLAGPEGLRRGHYRRPDFRHGRHRRRTDTGCRRNADRFLHLNRLQGSTWPVAAVAGAGCETIRPVRQSRHQESVSP